MRLWPLAAVLGVALIMARGLVDTPNLEEGLQARPTAETVAYVDERVVDLVIGMGVTFLGLALVAVFLAGLVTQLRQAAPSSLSGALAGLGGAAMLGATFVGYAVNVVLAGAAEENRAPTTVASVYTLADSLGYIGWTALGLVTAAVALAALRDGVLPRWLGWVSLTATLLFVLLAFLPFLSWAPALLWLLVAGLGLAIGDRRAARAA